MLLSKNPALEDRIITILLHGSKSVKSLNKELLSQKITVTIQAIYKILRSLIKDEVVIKSGNSYTLSKEWEKKILNAFEDNQNKISLSEKESIRFDLKSLTHYDHQWKNVVLALHDTHQKDPIFFYNHHYIWAYLDESRKQSEIEYYKSFSNKKRFAFSLVGSQDKNEISTKKMFQNDFVQWAIANSPFSKEEYLTIFGDYIITTKFSKSISKEIETIYQESSTPEELEEKLQKIGIEKKKVKLIIERNKEKAKKIRKKMAKDFFVPQELIREFDLF